MFKLLTFVAAGVSAKKLDQRSFGQGPQSFVSQKTNTSETINATCTIHDPEEKDFNVWGTIYLW